MKKLLTSLFIFALALNLLLIGSAAPVHGQDQLPPCDELGADQTPDPGVNCEDANKGLGNNPDRCDADNPGNGDECPTDEPTDAPTDEPADAPTDEPADAPTDEPADAPTDEPTDEPAAEPTDEPAAEPTDEPVAEPTDEPVAEPTDELTTEPTDEEVPADDGATDQAVPDEGKTDETVVDDGTGIGADTPAVIGSQGDGDIGSSAVVGTWSTVLFGVQNLGTGSATVNLELYTGGSGTAIPGPTIPAIPQNKGALVDMSSVSSGSYSGILTSDQPIAASVMNLNTQYQAGDSYLGFDSNSVDTVLICPVVFRQTPASVNSKIYIQDASGQGQDVKVEVFTAGNSSPDGSKNYTIAPNNTVIADIGNDGAYSGFSVFGYAKVSSLNSRNIAVLAETLQDANQGSTYVLQKYYPCQLVPAAGTSRNLVGPTLYNNLAPSGVPVADSAITVVNTESTPTNLTFTYVAFAPGNVPAGTFVANRVAAANASVPFYLPNQGELQQNTYGSVAVSSDTTDIVAIVSSNQQQPSPNNRVGWEIPAVNLAIGNSNLAMPVALKGNGNYLQVFHTLLTIYTTSCPSPGANISTRWVSFDASIDVTIDKPTNCSSSQVFYTPATDQMSALPSGFAGVVYVSSPNSMVGELIQVDYNQGNAGGHKAFGY